MSLRVSSRSRPLVPPVATPLGLFREVHEVVVERTTEPTAVGVVRCLTSQEAAQVAAELACLVDAEAGDLDCSMWGQLDTRGLPVTWASTWEELASSARPGPGLLALSGLDALVWDVAWTLRAQPVAPRVQPRVYWSGF